MKYRIVLSLILVILVAALATGACHPIVDTRSPADATATNEVRFALTAAAISPAEATATATAIVAALEATPAPECLIKGNINRAGERIYHLPGQLNYNRTVIDPELGEQWFCSEADAQAAGWRKALK